MAGIETERLTIGPFDLDDSEFILRLLNERAFIEHVGDKGVRDLDGARHYLRDGPMASYERFGFGLWRVALSDDGAPIGMAGLLKRDYLDDVDIGYALLSRFHGAGYAFEAAAAVMRHARDRLKQQRVLAIVNEDNEPSIGLLKKLGFKASGKVRIPEAEEHLSLYESVA